MKHYSVKGNFKGLELDLGIVSVLDCVDTDSLKDDIMEKHNVSDVILKEISFKKAYANVEDVLPF